MEETPPSPAAKIRPSTFIAMVVVVGLYLLPVAGHPPATNPNELVRIELTLAMAMWSTIDIESPARTYGLSEDVSVRDGKLFADKAPGLSMAAVPLVWLSRVALPSIPGTDLPQYWPLRHLLTAVLVALATALVCFLIAVRFPDLRAAGWAPLALIAALATPLWTYGTIFFGHAPAAVMIAVAWMLLLQPGSGSTNPRLAFLGGACAGFAVTTEYPTLLLVAIVYLSLVIRRTPVQTLGTSGLGLVAGLLPALVYNHVAFGAPWLTGYAFKFDPGFQQIHATGLSGVSVPGLEGIWGVLFGASRGLFFYSPVLLLAPIGLWLMHRRHGWRDVAPLTAAVMAYLAFGAGFVDWRAGWCAAARHLVPVIPLLAIPTMVAMVAMVRRKWGLLVLVGLVAVSATRGFLTLVITPFFPPEFSNPLGQIVLPSLRDGMAAPTLVSSVLGSSPGIVWTAAAAMTVAALIWALGSLGGGSTTRIAIVFVLAICAQFAWWVWLDPPPDPHHENFRAQLLVGLGHTDGAARIDTDPTPETSSDQVQP